MEQFQAKSEIEMMPFYFFKETQSIFAKSLVVVYTTPSRRQCFNFLTSRTNSRQTGLKRERECQTSSMYAKTAASRIAYQHLSLCLSAAPRLQTDSHCRRRSSSCAIGADHFSPLSPYRLLYERLFVSMTARLHIAACTNRPTAFSHATTH